MKRTLTLAFLLSGFMALAQKQSKKDYLITMETSMGTMHLVLFDEAPLHKANYIKLAKEKFYDDLLFHRVKKEFMIQGGDPSSKNAKPGTRLGSGGGDIEKIPFEYEPNRLHYTGALAAARGGDPEKRSSGSQFYVVTGKKWTKNQLIGFMRRGGYTYTDEQMEAYMETGGAPYLDANYTVFGQVVAGIEVAEAIQNVAKDKADRPNDDILMKIRAKKMSKKKITKKFGYNFQ